MNGTYVPANKKSGRAERGVSRGIAMENRFFGELDRYLFHHGTHYELYN